MALEQLGLEENRLYKMSKKDYLENNIELKKEKPEILDKRYEHYEKKRLDSIQQARDLRHQIIENKKNSTSDNSRNSTKGFNNNEESKSKTNIQLQTQDNEIIKKKKEKLELLKKQQLYEIKNLIDFEYDINETRKKNELKDKENK